MKNCPGHPDGACRDRIPDGWSLCQKCRGRKNEAKVTRAPVHDDPPVIKANPDGSVDVPPIPTTPLQPIACEGGHAIDHREAAEVIVRFKAVDGTTLGEERLCQPCADVVALPWVRAQREPIMVRP